MGSQQAEQGGTSGAGIGGLDRRGKAAVADLPSFQSCETSFEGAQVHFLEGGAGPPLLMLHGVGPGTSAYGNFRPILEPLARSFHVFAVDLIGFGGSGRKSKQPFFDFDHWYRQAQHMIRLIADGPVAILGHSLSGALALKLAAHDARISKVLTTASVGTRYRVNAALERIWTYPATREELHAVMTQLLFDATHLTDEFLDGRLQLLRGPGYRDYFTAMFSGEKQRLIDSWVLAERDLASIRCDVVMVHGREDLPCPYADTTEQLSKKIRNVDVVLLAKCGHSPAVEHPQKVLRAMDFLLQT